MDGTRLRESWYSALDSAQAHFRQLLTSHASSEWKRVPVTNDGAAPTSKGKGRASAVPELTDVMVHRKATKSGGESVYRAVLEVPIGDEPVSLETWKSVLVTPELRKEWDPAVESAQLLEMFDQATRISKVNFRLGWPANPRDAVMISRTLNDASTLIDISTSLPRSPDEPTYVRPSPPYVRSDVALFAWCIQRIQPQGNDQSSRVSSAGAKIRITCFWQHNFRLLWNLGTGLNLGQQLGAMTIGLLKTVQERGTRVPLLTGYGNGVTIERVRFAVDREALSVDYSIVPEDDDHPQPSEHSLEELHTLREIRRLTRSVEFSLSSAHGWDVQLSTKGSSEEVSQLPWTAHATRPSTSTESADAGSSDQPKFILNIKHAPLPNDHSVLKARVVIELSGPSSGLRLNGISQPVEELETRDPSSFFISQSMFQDASSTAEKSFQTQSSAATAITSTSRTSTIGGERPQLSRTPTERSAVAEKSILSRVKRNYIYFSSLLQEPEAKWKQTVESRGVSVSQLDSIDPTLVVYRAEATFVGISLWDLYAAITTPGARAYWDKLYDDAVLLEDVNELSELWHLKTKPTWPVNGRDMVVLKTVYKSPTTIHVFAFSADDPNLFPQVPPAEPNVIRTQVDLQGWAIEALSPNTVLVTLLEQSDPKGWANKGSIPQQMITAVAGIGEFAIKCGGPPIVTRLEGAKATRLRYDHDRGSFRVEYEGCAKRRATIESSAGRELSSTSLPVIECEIRCDLDTWASSLDIVVDPPPQSIATLRRHRFSSAGGGLWLTITHDAVFSEQERLQVIVRRGPMSVPKEKGLVMVNGVKVEVVMEEMPEREMKNLTKQKRVKPARVPLDQPPVLGVIRRRKAEWDADKDPSTVDDGSSSKGSSSPTASTTSFVTTAPSFATSFSKFFSYAVEQATTTTQQAVAAISPAMAGGEDAVPSASKLPMQYALEALAFVQDLHSQTAREGWTLVSEKDLPVHRRLYPEISPVIPVHRGEKVIEGVAAEEIASVLRSYDCRKQWDARFDSANHLEAYGADAHTAFIVMKGGFPFRDRGFYVSSLIARETVSPPSSRRNAVEAEQLSSESRAAIFYVSASFSPESVGHFAAAKYNPYSLPIGRIFVDAWILETLDPYSAENYAIPSTRCIRVVAMDYAGSIPAAVNSMINGTSPKSILAIESYLKNLSPSPSTRLPAVGFMLAPPPDDKLRTPQAGWTLRKKDSSRRFLTAAFVPSTKVSSSVIIVNGAASLAPPAANDRTPRPSRMVQNATPTSSEPETTPASSPQTETLEASESERRVRAARSRSPRAREVGGRSSTMFTPRGEVRHPVDLLVSELIVDSKLYPDGYDVLLRSRIEKSAKTQLALPPSTAVQSEYSDLPGVDETVLPISCAAYTLPPSPLHSAGLNVDRPPRHLLRFTLPTAQYQMSTIVDPLTSETRSAPPKPQWLLDLEEGRAIIQIRVRPRTGASESASALPADKTTSVAVNGNMVAVMSEKESLTALGREELLDTRAAKTDVLARSVSAEEQVPAGLQAPLAVAQHLLEEPGKSSEPSDAAEPQEKESMPTPCEAAEEAPESVSPAAPAVEQHAPEGAASGFMWFLNGYTLPFGSSRRSSALLSLPSSGDAVRSPSGPGAPKEKPIAADTGSDGVAGSVLTRTQSRSAPMYPLSTLIIVALIAFLVGSLLRSLLSPADFIYVVTDEKELGTVSAGWREMKRLLEFKYVLGGWDFQIAVVRRH
ncbi:hypothetical protein BD414DRAFT_61769 [Trametes punicea]|nr:hypothetical protein BD414DRAFT_61769 [Trametes punicea]